ncbi:MAG: FAD-dependent oxidoreductase [Candidatus Nealsonbacteria bacterium]|nr:FAD-dependent oxidoreductase [Candidatus Nealsonbacteria bacterium]
MTETGPIFKENTLSRKTGSWRDHELKQKPRYLRESDTISTCMVACPIHQDIREWLLALKNNDINEAAKIILRHNPLASSVSLVCPSFCERGCKYLRECFDEPIAINASEKFLGNWIISGNYSPNLVKISSDRKIAVVGSGPAGLTCAYVLRNKGYAVTIFEKMPIPGGLLRFGIPEDHLPKEIVAKETDLIQKAGVELKCGTEINESNFGELKKGFHAIFLAPGFSEGKKLDIPGAELVGVVTALDFLKKANLGEIGNLNGKTIIVIGAGNTAMDSARTAKKLGAARVIVAYRRKKENMKAFGNEIGETEKAGVQFNFEMTPLRIVRNIPDGLLAEFQNNDLKIIFACDFVIMAVGQQKSPFFEKLLKEKTIEQLEKEGIFIGGDLLSGPKTVAHAIGTGNEGAEKIVAYLERREYRRGKIRTIVRRKNINLSYFEPAPRTAEIQVESRRCFSCGLCRECENCLNFCPEPVVKKTGDPEKPYVIDYNYCKGCGICAKECPRGVIVMEEEKELKYESK